MHILSMSRRVQGMSIVLGSLFVAILVLAAAVAWGPHQCALMFPKIIGCAVGHYEGLTGGILAAGTALFAGWLAWSAVQVQIAAKERRAFAERVEVEKVLQADLNHLAEGLSSIWKILLAIDAPPSIPPEDARHLLEGVIYGIEKIANIDWLSTSRQMVEKLGWERRRYYNELFQGIERLEQFRDIDNFDVGEALSAVRSASVYFELLRPDSARFFSGLWRHSPKAWTLGYAIAVHAGLCHTNEPLFDPRGHTTD
jgi:hypothetical protein